MVVAVDVAGLADADACTSIIDESSAGLVVAGAVVVVVVVVAVAGAAATTVLGGDEISDNACGLALAAGELTCASVAESAPSRNAVAQASGLVKLPIMNDVNEVRTV